MKLLLDEMYTGLKDHLEVLGWEVETVKEAGISGKKDKQIVEHAQKNDFLLVTQDQKPAELAQLLEVKHVFITNAAIAAMVDKEIKQKYSDLRAKPATEYNNKN
jgi:predicted nuclease of predicted toxin-antitoxin system